MGPDELKAEYWKLATAAIEVLQWWDLQQEDADGDWGSVISAMEKLRTTVYGQTSNFRRTGGMA